MTEAYYNRYGYFRYSRLPDEDLMDLEAHRVLPPDKRPKRLPAVKWAELKARIHAESDHTCAYCGRQVDFAICDHAVPLSRGGTNDQDNLVTSCERCNASKGMLTTREFKKKQSRASDWA